MQRADTLLRWGIGIGVGRQQHLGGLGMPLLGSMVDPTPPILHDHSCCKSRAPHCRAHDRQLLGSDLGTVAKECAQGVCIWHLVLHVEVGLLLGQQCDLSEAATHR